MNFSGLVASALFAGVIMAHASLAEELVSLPTRAGVTQSFYLTMPAGPPVASVMLFTGGDGKLRNYGPVEPRRGNFLVRSRNRFAAQGFVVAVMDAPSDESGGMERFRLADAHRRDIAAVIAHLRHLAPVPVWLIGTSMGTLSAANGATLETGGPDGLVLTSSIMRTSKHAVYSVFDAGPNHVKVPTLIVHNREDGCIVCPFSDASDLLSRFTHAPRKELIAFHGGDTPITEPCEALSRHGYLGIEDEVVAAIAGWIKTP